MVQSVFFINGKDSSESPGPNVVGGKGHRLLTDSQQFLVPRGIIVSSYVCREYYARDPGLRSDFVRTYVEKLIMPALKHKLFKDEQFPLVSVRSGAAVSMPGMMETILNVGLGTNECRLQDWRTKLGDEAALDCMRRLVYQWATTVKQSKETATYLHERFEEYKNIVKKKGYNMETHEALVRLHVKTYQNGYGPFPKKFVDQLTDAVEAVFKSWMSSTAIGYRNLNNIPHEICTAVNIVEMKFGNLNENSCAGVLFTRDPSNGEPKFYGEFLVGAQGDDVVDGTHTPRPLKEMPKLFPHCASDLNAVAGAIEKKYGDMQEIEFTVEDGTLWLLQSRVGKREPRAAVRIAKDMVEENIIGINGLGKVLSTQQVTHLTSERIAPDFKVKPTYQGEPGSGGVAQGLAVGSSEMAVGYAGIGKACILVRPYTETTDLSGMVSAAGILTEVGGKTSHAAVVARSLKKPAVVGAGNMMIDTDSKVTICGYTGRVWVNVDVPVIKSKEDKHLDMLYKMAMRASGKVEKIEYVNDGNPLKQFPMASESPEVYIETLSVADALVDMEVLVSILKVRKYKKVILDLRSSEDAKVKEDEDAWDIFGKVKPSSLSPTQKKLDYLDGVKSLTSIKKTILLMLGNGKYDIPKGFKRLKYVDTLAELIDAGYNEVIFGKSFSSPLRYALDHDQLKTLEVMAKAIGVTVSNGYDAVTRKYALLELLGKAK